MPEKTGTVRVIKDRGAVDVSVLLREGVFVNLEMGRWRAEQQIAAEDVGLQGMDQEHLRKYLNLGKKTLIHPKLQAKLRSIESCARGAILRFSIQTPFGKFVTAVAYPLLDAEMERFEKAWFEMRDELCKHMALHQQDVRAGYQELAKQMYLQFKKQDVNKDKYARRYASRIVKSIPGVKEIRSSFSFNFQIHRVPEVTVLESKIREAILSEEASIEKLKTIHQSEEKVRTLNAMMAARLEKEKAEKVDSFINAVNEQVRSAVLQVAAAAKHSLKNNKQLIGKTATQLRSAIARFRMMNVLNDSAIEKEMDEVERLLAWKKKDGTLETRNRQLAAVLTDIGREAIDLSLDLRMPAERGVREDIVGESMSDHDYGLDRIKGIELSREIDRRTMYVPGENDE